MIKPSQFLIFPIGSILQNHESETVALNIIKILSTTGDTWRKLDWFEYLNIRHKDGSFTMAEKHYFDKVIDYTVSPDTIKLFCAEWKEIASQPSN
jgi:hypothetical protein